MEVNIPPKAGVKKEGDEDNGEEVASGDGTIEKREENGGEIEKNQTHP